MKTLLVLMLLASPCLAQSPQQESVVYAAQFRPPAVYAQWYRETERCVGLRGDFSKITWVATPKPWTQRVKSDTPGRIGWTYGLWNPLHGDTAMILLNQEDWLNPYYVKHEMIHDLLWRHGFSIPDGKAGLADSVNIRAAHPAPPFERCAPTYIGEMRKRWAQEQNPFKQVYQP